MTPEEIIQLSEILKGSDTVNSGGGFEFIYSLLAIVASNGALFLIAGKRIMHKIVGKVVKAAVKEEMTIMNKTLNDNEELTRERFNMQIEEFRFLNQYNYGTEEKLVVIKERLTTDERYFIMRMIFGGHVDQYDFVRSWRTAPFVLVAIIQQRFLHQLACGVQARFHGLFRYLQDFTDLHITTAGNVL